MPTEVADKKERPQLEVAHILRRFGADYQTQHRLSPEQLRAYRDITECRTPILGGHLNICDQCDEHQIAYNSCRNRHCPKCGSVLKAEWVQNQLAHLLPIHYFHVVFTIDHALLPLVRSNRKRCYELLMRSAAASLKEMGQQHLGGEIGILAVLHTWGQQLTEHPHVHCLVTGGALSHDGKQWRPTKPDFLFPIEALSSLFKAKFFQGLQHLHHQERLSFAGQSAHLADPAVFASFLHSLLEKNWMVYAKPPFGDPEQVVDYLGRYTHRIAISNHRLQSVTQNQVTFSYRDYRHDGQLNSLTLAADEFIRRFLLHVLPSRFVRIRYFGLLATANRAKKLDLCRRLLFVLSQNSVQPLTRQQIIERMLGRLPGLCPHCLIGHLHHKRDIQPHLHRAAWLRAIRG